MSNSSLLRSIALAIVLSLLIAVLLAVVAARAMAAEITIVTIDAASTKNWPAHEYGSLVIDGQIVEGDYGRALKVVSDAKNRGIIINQAVLRSPGGDLKNGMQIGALVRSMNLRTWVPPNSQCISACVYIWAGGIVRITGTPLGIHGIYDPITYKFATDKATLDFAADYWTGMGMPKALWLRSLTLKNVNDVYWLPVAEAEILAFTNSAKLLIPDYCGAEITADCIDSALIALQTGSNPSSHNKLIYDRVEPAVETLSDAPVTPAKPAKHKPSQSIELRQKKG